MYVEFKANYVGATKIT